MNEGTLSGGISSSSLLILYFSPFMPAWLDPDEAHTFENLACLLEIDVRFFKVAESAGMRLEYNGTTTARSFWLWFGNNWQSFRRTAGMREVPLKKTLKGKALEREKFALALVTIVEFFGVLPCERAVSNAAEMLGVRRTVRG